MRALFQLPRENNSIRLVKENKVENSNQETMTKIKTFYACTSYEYNSGDISV